MNVRLETHECIDILSSLAFADDYNELLRLFDSLIPKDDSAEFEVLQQEFLNFIYDNADINIQNITGLGTWHTLGGFVVGTHGSESPEPEIPRSIKIRSVEQ